MTTDARPLLERLAERRSIRVYTDEPVPEADLIDAIRVGQTASTSSAVQAYACIRVTDPDKRAEIADLAGPQEKVRAAPEFLLFCGDARRHQLAACNASTTHAPCLEAFLLAVIDTALFAEKTAIALETLGYGLCYIGGVRNDLPRLDRVLRLPPGVFPLFGMCVGRPAQDPAPRPRLPLEAVLMENAYADDPAMTKALADYDATYHAYLESRGATPRGWTDAMAAKFARPERVNLAEYYAAKGARLDAGPPA